jgi:hypothetical protein
VLPLALAWHGYQLAIGWEPFVRTLGTLQRQASGHTGLIAKLADNSVYYLGTLAWGGFPYSLLYPAAAAIFCFPGRGAERRHEWRLLGCYALTIWCFFALIGLAHPWYIVPLYGFFALAVAYWLRCLATAELPPISAALGIGFLALAPWLRLEWVGFDPFAEPAISVNPSLAWVGWMGMPAWLVATSTFITAGGGAWWIASRIGRREPVDRRRRALAGVLTGILLAVGAVRVSSSLAHTDHVSEVERFARDLEARTAQGTPVVYPVELPIAGRFVADFFFHRHHRLRRVGIRRFELVGPREAGTARESTIPGP